MKSDEQVIEDRDDIEFLNRPHLWSYQFTPLKQRMVAGDIKVGVVFRRSEGGFQVLENMTIFGTSFGEEVIEHQYDTADEVIAAGWIVD